MGISLDTVANFAAEEGRRSIWFPPGWTVSCGGITCTQHWRPICSEPKEIRMEHFTAGSAMDDFVERHNIAHCRNRLKMELETRSIQANNSARSGG
jgi:hypothetical protein